jgi:flagellar biosynthesis protein FliP
MISEIRRGFEIGFLIVLPFLVIDLVVATITMSMGMMMLPPTAISLPFKILFFVLIDGWNLLVGIAGTIVCLTALNPLFIMPEGRRCSISDSS